LSNEAKSFLSIILIYLWKNTFKFYEWEPM